MKNDSAAKKSANSPVGRVVHDERGNAVWQACRSFESEDTLHVLLNTDELALLEGGPVPATQAVPGGDPYARDLSLVVNGNVERKRPRTDLRALSAQIVAERERRQRTG